MNHSGKQNAEGFQDTALFTTKVLNWFKIFQVKSKGKDIWLRYDFEAVFSDKNELQSNLLLEFENMEITMKNTQRNGLNSEVQILQKPYITLVMD